VHGRRARSRRISEEVCAARERASHAQRARPARDGNLNVSVASHFLAGGLKRLPAAPPSSGKGCLASVSETARAAKARSMLLRLSYAVPTLCWNCR